jgi:hypothetical protein
LCEKLIDDLMNIIDVIGRLLLVDGAMLTVKILVGCFGYLYGFRISVGSRDEELGHATFDSVVVASEHS